MLYSDGTNPEQNAEMMARYYHTRKKRAGVVNICTGRQHWNACDYIDFGMQEFGEHGCECWKQDSEHKCVRLIEIKE